MTARPRRWLTTLPVAGLVLIVLLAGALPAGTVHGFANPKTMAGTPPSSGLSPPPRSSPGVIPAAGTVVHTGGVLKDLALDPARGRVYLADYADNEVVVAALGNGAILARIPVRAQPSSLAIDPADQNLYVAHAGNMSVAQVNLATLAVSRYIPLGFLPWQLVAPDNVSLIITSNMDQWSMQYAVVLNLTSGGVLQTIGGGMYQGPIVGLSPDRQWAYTADQLIPMTITVYHHLSGGWVTVGSSYSNTWGLYGGFGRDFAVTPDDAYVYVAANTSASPAYSCLNKFYASNLTFVGAIGAYPNCATVVLSRASGRIASAGFSNAIHVALADGTFVNDIPTSEIVDRMRLLPDESAFVAILGTTSGDLGIFPTSAVSPAAPAPSSFWNHSPAVSALVASLEPWSNLSASLSLDGMPLAGTQFNRSTGWVTAPAPGPLTPGTHTITAAVLHGSVPITSVAWSFTVETAPPSLSVVAPPATVRVPYVWVNGTASDPSGVTVTVAHRPVPVAANGSFAANVSLLQGPNAIEVHATNGAGTQAWSNVSVDFAPALRWAVDVWDRFRILIPYGWTNQTNGTNAFGQTYGALLMNWTGTVGVGTDKLTGPPPRAYDFLEQVLANLSVNGQYTLLSPPKNATMDGLDAATAVVSYLPIGYYALPVGEVVTVIVGPAWGRIWTIEGTVATRWLAPIAPVINQTVASFQAWPASLPPSPPSPSVGVTPAGLDWVPIAVAVLSAAAVFAAVILWDRLRRSRRTPPPPPS